MQVDTQSVSGDVMQTTKQEMLDMKSIDPKNFFGAPSNWEMAAHALMWLIGLTVIFWIIYYSLRPPFVLNPKKELDTSKILLAAFLTALIIVVLLFIAKFALKKY